MKKEEILFYEEYSKNLPLDMKGREDEIRIINKYIKRFKSLNILPEEIQISGLDKRIKNANFPPKIDIRWESLKQKITNTKIFNSPIIINGLDGCGKTTLACCIAAQQAIRGKRVKYIPISKYLDLTRKSFEDNEVLFELSHLKDDFDVFVFDNLIPTPGGYSNWEKNQIGQIIKYRVESRGRDDIIVTNITDSSIFVSAFGSDLCNFITKKIDGQNQFLTIRMGKEEEYGRRK